MSNFLNKIPVSPITSFGNPSVPNGSTIGTNFSILQTGGYMEVYTLSGLTYTIPPATTGIIEFSGNSIPIQLTKGSGSVFSPDVLTLNSDNISSGRRKLGMLAYVYETKKIYQYNIDNYDTLWNNATGATGPGGPTVVISNFGTTVKNNSAAGIAFINAWTASTISGIGGYNDTNASWRVLSTGGSSSGGTSFTGGTVSGATIFTGGLTANTFSAGTYQNLPVSGVTGGTGISASSSNGLVTIVNTSPDQIVSISGGTGIQTGGTYPNFVITNTLPDQVVTITGGTNIGINGAYPNFGINFTGSTGVSGNFLPLSGGTVTGATIFTSGLTANTISATTYQNLPIDIYVSGGTIGNGPDTANNKIILNRSNGNDVTLDNLVDIVNVSKSEMDTIISIDKVIRGKTYKISNCDTSLYNNGTANNGADVYTTIYLLGLENDKLSESGIGVFYTPKYTEPTFKIFVDGAGFKSDDYYIWGGFVWQLKGGNGSYNSIDIFTLPNQFEKKYPFVNGEDGNLKAFYNEQYDDIIYDYTNDRIIYRNEQNSNIVSTTYENINYWITVKGFWNPIRVFQWGHLVNFSGDSVIHNQQIINSYNENINYLGQYQKDFYFNNLSYQRDFFVDSSSSQSNFIFDNQSYQNDITISGASYQSGITLNNNSYQEQIEIDVSSYQNQITLNNNSYQDRIKIFGIESEGEMYPANQSYFNFNNGSYHFDILLESGDGKQAIQNYFNFNNNSYQNNIILNERTQRRLDFTNNSGQSNIQDTSQDSLIFDSSTQINSAGSLIQTNITIKNYDRNLTSVTSPETNRFFIHDLPTDNTALVYIGKINNQLVQVTKPIDVFVTGGTYNSGTGIITFRNNSGTTFSVSGITSGGGTFTGGTVTGPTIFTSGLTANTISATTYQNLPVSGVTGGTGISASTSDGLVTIINTLPDQVVTISGGTGISTGGTYPNFVLTNTSPDQIVTITGGTNISVNGTYPNFGINFTGSTGSSGDFLPLSGGTVSGATSFTGGLTANTIYATQYLNLPKDIFVTGGTYTSGNAIFTNNSGGTFTVTGFAVGSGGGQLFYLNLSESEGSNRLLSTTASTSSQQTSGVTISSGVTGTIASFQSSQLNTILIPGGVWSFHLHSYKEDSNASFDIFVEVYKRTSGGTQTLLFQTEPTTVLTNSPLPSMQITESYFSGTSLVVSDSIVTIVRATNTGNQSKIITLVTEGTTYYSYVVSSLPTQQGLTCDTLSGCSIIQTIQTDVSNKLDKSGGTITGNLIINSGLTATTISATTYLNLPSSGGSFTGGTVSGATEFTGGLTANTISATTITSPSISPYGLIVATSIGYQNIF
jgi:hypothetical protein